MSAVMMILTNAPITHVPGKGGRPENLVLTAAAALRVTNETAAAMIANVTTVSVTIANAMIFIATMRLRGVPFPALGDETPVKKITAGSAGRALSIRKCCVVSVRKRPAYMAKTPAVRCSEPSGSYRSRPVYSERDAAL